MTKLTGAELDERIEAIRPYDLSKDISAPYIKQLIRDCIEAVTPKKDYTTYYTEPNKGIAEGLNATIDTIERNTDELLKR